MANMNWNAGSKSAFAPGIYLVEVISASERRSKNGDLMFIAKLGAVQAGNAEIADDVLMLEGKGAGIGLGKLKALGFKGDEPAIEHYQLVGRRVWAALARDEWTDQNGVKQMRLKVDISAKESRCGYWFENEKPAGAIEPLSPDEAPF